MLFFHAALEIPYKRFYQKKRLDSLPKGEFPFIHHVNKHVPGKASTGFVWATAIVKVHI